MKIERNMFSSKLNWKTLQKISFLTKAINMHFKIGNNKKSIKNVLKYKIVKLWQCKNNMQNKLFFENPL